MSETVPNPRQSDADQSDSEAPDLDKLPSDAIEALPDDLRGRLERGDARMATEQDVLVDPDDTYWVWEECNLGGEDVLVGFELRSISWQRKNQIFKDNLKQFRDGRTKFEIDTFQRDVAEEVVASHTIETERSLTQLLTGMDNDVGEKLEPHLPDAGAEEIEEAEEKN